MNTLNISRLSKPRPGSTPNLLHPFGTGLVHAFLFNEGAGRMVTDSVSGMHGFFRNGTPLWVPTAFGGGVRFNGSSDIGNFDHPNWHKPTSPVLNTDAEPFSVVMGLRVDSAAGFGTLYSNGNVGQYTNSQKFHQYNILLGNTFALNTPIIFSSSSNWVTPTYLMVNGVVDVSVVGAVAPYLDPANTIGGHGSEYFNGDISFLYVYRRYIPPESMAMIQADPFAMFDDASVMGSIKKRAVAGAASQAGHHMLNSATSDCPMMMGLL